MAEAQATAHCKSTTHLVPQVYGALEGTRMPILPPSGGYRDYSHKEKLNCSLYTPTDQDFETCPKSALKCFANETKVLIQEWEDVNFRVVRPYRNLSKKLEILSAKLNQSESECRQCEFLNEQNAETFLKQLKSTVEMMNRLYC
ncbi:interleukin 15, like isoform X4 [Sander vitreus]